MFKYLFVSLAAFFLTSCGGSSVPVNYYRLNTEFSSSKASILKNIEVDVAPMLRTDSILYQSSENKIDLSGSNLWIEPLSQDISKSLASNLNQIDSSYKYISSDNKKADIYIYFDNFQGKFGGVSLMSGSYEINNRSYDFMYSISQEKDGYDALVNSLKKGLKDLSNEIYEKMHE